MRADETTEQLYFSKFAETISYTFLYGLTFPLELTLLTSDHILYLARTTHKKDVSFILILTRKTNRVPLTHLEFDPRLILKDRMENSTYAYV